MTDTTPPLVTSCPEDATIECPAEPAFGTPVFTDACDDELVVSHSDVRTELSCGYQATRTWTATDDAGLTAQCDQTITVTDTTPPVLVAKSDPVVLWPANHQYVTLKAAELVQQAGDGCDTSVNADSVRILSATSNEPDDGKGSSDGKTTNDIVIAPDGLSVELRAERDSLGSGRVYTLTLQLADACGNVASSKATATVPLSVKKPKP